MELNKVVGTVSSVQAVKNCYKANKYSKYFFTVKLHNVETLLSDRNITLRYINENLNDIIEDLIKLEH